MSTSGSIKYTVWSRPFNFPSIQRATLIPCLFSLTEPTIRAILAIISAISVLLPIVLKLSLQATDFEINISYYFSMNTDYTMSQVESNKAVINRYFEAYKTKNEGIFDEIIAPDYIDHGQVAYMSSPGKGVAGAKNDLKNLLNKFDDYSFVIEAMIASESLPDLVGTYWKGSLTPKASPPDAPHINFRGGMLLMVY